MEQVLYTKFLAYNVAYIGWPHFLSISSPKIDRFKKISPAHEICIGGYTNYSMPPHLYQRRSV